MAPCFKMDVLKCFVVAGCSYSVDIQWIDDKPIVRASDIAAILDMSSIRSSLRDYDHDEKAVLTVPTPGGPQTVLYLTERGLYRLLMQSRKPIARPFQKWVAGVIESIRAKGRYVVQEALREAKESAAAAEQTVAAASAHAAELKQQLHELAENVKSADAIARHNALVQSHGADDYLVYYGIIRSEGEDTVLLKIGSTKNLAERVKSLVVEFGSMRIVEVFQTPLHRQFETFLHEHPQIAAHRFSDPIHNGHRSREVFLVDPRSLQTAIAIANRNVYRYKSSASMAQLLEAERMQLHNSMLAIQAAAEANAPIRDVTVYIAPDERRYTQARGMKIQRYTPDGQTLLHTYPGCAEAARDPQLAAPVAQLICSAISTHTVYKGFRWAALDRSLPDGTVQDIGATVPSKQVKKGMVAMLDLDRANIVDVFPDMKAAAENRKFKGLAAISTAIKKRSQSGGHMWSMWHDCSEELQAVFLQRAQLPDLRKRSNGQSVQQVHPLTGCVVKRFASVAHVQTNLRISRGALKTAIENARLAKGYLWRYEITESEPV